MIEAKDELLRRLVATVQDSAKYRTICPELIASIGAQELAKRANLKAAVKATKNKLHQVGGAYWQRTVDYSEWLDRLQLAARSQDRAQLLQICDRIMAHHTSTQERLPMLQQFYTRIFAALPPIHSVLDIACGLNPLAMLSMPLAENATYYACDIYQDTINFINQFMKIVNVSGEAQVCNLIQTCPNYQVDVAFVFKTLPCLEQIDKHAGIRLLEAIQSQVTLVSFPNRSLGGKNKGMASHYESRLRTQIADKPWSVQRLEFPTELVFLITR